MKPKKQWRKIVKEVKKQPPPEPKPMTLTPPPTPKELNAPPITTQLRDGFEDAAEALGNGGQFKVSKTIRELEQDKEVNGS